MTLTFEAVGTFARRNAAAGFAAWCLLGLAVHMRWTTLGMEWGLQLEIAGFYILGPLVVSPQAIALGGPGRSALGGRAWRIAALAQPAAATLAVASFYVAPGTASATLTLPWMGVAVALAACGALRFLERRFSPLEEVWVDAAYVFQPVGAAWLAASRAGMTPMGFQEPIVLLTAVHFQFAGLAAPVFAAALGRQLRAWGGPARPVAHALSAGVVAGVPLLAAGIGLSRQTRHLELAASLLLAFSLGALAIFTLLLVVPRLRRPVPTILLALACGSAVVAMHYAGGYAMSHWRGAAKISIPRMVSIHGFLNAAGFAACGMLAWTLLAPRPGPQADGRASS